MRSIWKLTPKSYEMRFIYIPCKPVADIPGPVWVENSVGQHIQINAGWLEIVEGKLCVVAEWFKIEDDKKHVRFADGTEIVVRPPQWPYSPCDYKDFFLAV